MKTETLCDCEKVTFDIAYAGGIYAGMKNRRSLHRCTRAAVVTRVSDRKPLCRQHAKKEGVITAETVFV